MPRKFRLLLLIVAVGISAAILLAGQAPAKSKPQSTCPNCDMKLENKDIYIDAAGYRIYACSDYCRDKVKADPPKYIKKLRDRGEEPERLEQGPGKK